MKTWVYLIRLTIQPCMQLFSTIPKWTDSILVLLNHKFFGVPLPYIWLANFFCAYCTKKQFGKFTQHNYNYQFEHVKASKIYTSHWVLVIFVSLSLPHQGVIPKTLTFSHNQADLQLSITSFPDQTARVKKPDPGEKPGNEAQVFI